MCVPELAWMCVPEFDAQLWLKVGGNGSIESVTQIGYSRIGDSDRCQAAAGSPRHEQAHPVLCAATHWYRVRQARLATTAREEGRKASVNARAARRGKPRGGQHLARLACF